MTMGRTILNWGVNHCPRRRGTPVAISPVAEAPCRRADGRLRTVRVHGPLSVLLAVALLIMPNPFAREGVGLAQSDCTFTLGFKAVRDQIPDIVGNCLENERFELATGNALQSTSGGLLAWRKTDNWTAFTDGATTWINGPQGLVSRPNAGPLFSWETAAPPSQPLTAPTAGTAPLQDAAGGVPQCFGQPATIVGSGVIAGTTGDDVIVGSAGPDQIDGNPGNDVICGGGGDDIIDGSTGNDKIDGGPGNDRISGGTGNDLLLGDEGDDVVEAVTGDDTINGGPGNNTCDSGTGNTPMTNCGPVSASLPSAPPPARPTPMPAPRSSPVIANATYLGRTTGGFPVRIETDWSGQSIDSFLIGEAGGQSTIISRSCGQLRVQLFRIVAGNLSIRSDGGFEFSVPTNDNGIKAGIDVAGRFAGGSVTGTFKWIFPKNGGCNSSTISWSAKA